MQTLKIEIPQGYEVDSFDKLSGEIKFREKPKKVTERIKTIEDVLKENNYEDQDAFEDSFHDLEPDEKAYILLKLLCKSLNEGWEPDWSDSSQYKYFPWFEMGGSSGFRFGGYGDWDSGTNFGSRLCFKSRELAEYAGKQFTNLYQQFMVIN